MNGLVRSFGRALATVFVAAVVIWAVVLIVAPQLTMVERALTAPKRALDSSVAASLVRDAQTCVSVLKTKGNAPAASGGMAVPSPNAMAIPSPNAMAVPSPNAMAVPSPNVMAVPSIGGMAVPTAQSGAGRGYILQCDRADTHRQVVRTGGEKAYLDALYDLPRLAVQDSDPIETQIATAQEIAALADALADRLRLEEARGPGLTTRNFAALTQAVLIPMTPETRAIEARQPSNILFGLMGLRFEHDGEVYARIGLITLVRTLLFAVCATALALVLCYPIAYKVALATKPERAVWLFLGLVIPYAIVELMRVYAWTTIIDNRGLINDMLIWLGAISEPIQFKRMPGTTFLVIVYTYVLFMVFPMYNVMSTLDRNQIEAAHDLGASTWRVHARIVIPHAKPGIAVGCIATFMLAAGAFSVPRIISRGLQSEWFSQTIYNKFFESENSNVGAAYSFAYTLVCFALVALFMWIMRTRLKDFARVQS